MKKSFKARIPLEPLTALQKLLEYYRCPWAIIGGIASSLLGKPRFTADIDGLILIDFDDLPKIIKKAKDFGFQPRIADLVGFARKHRVILLQHKKSKVNVDLSIGLLSFELEAIRKSKRYKIGNIVLNLPTVEDLIVFKAVAHRPQDLIDIRELIKFHPKIDKKYIEKNVSEFAHILEKPEIWNNLKLILYPKKGKES